MQRDIQQDGGIGAEKEKKRRIEKRKRTSFN